ncbi:MAG: hypothetical protein Q9P90_15395 [candidate division KSB1 bacterium]|nr:hypothetical protein [candidate division KSB1 bacterium]
MQAKPPSGEFLQIPVKIPAFSVLKFFEIVILQEINRHHSALSTGCKRRGHHEARPLGRGQAPCLLQEDCAVEEFITHKMQSLSQ